MTVIVAVLLTFALLITGARGYVSRMRALDSEEELEQVTCALHDAHCRAGDWPHDGACVAFEGYEVTANPVLSVLAKHGFARRPDVVQESGVLLDEETDGR